MTAALGRRIPPAKKKPKVWRDWKNVGLHVRRILHKPPKGWHDRDRYVNRERVFAEVWEFENTRPGASHVLDSLLVVPTRADHRGARRNWFGAMEYPAYFRVAFKNGPSRRDRVVAATVIQWLGSNVGFSFVEECLRKCGFRIVRIENREIVNRKGGAF